MLHACLVHQDMACGTSSTLTSLWDHGGYTSAAALRAPRTTEHRCLWRRPSLPTGTGGTLGKKGLKKWEVGLPASKPAPEAGTQTVQEDGHSSLRTGSRAASLEEAVFAQCNGLLTRSYLFAFAVGGQQLLLFPGEGRS